MTGVTGIQRNKGNHLDVPATHQRGVSGLCFTGADDESNTARSSGFPSKLENDGAGRRKPPEEAGTP